MKIEVEIMRTNKNTLENEAVLFTRRDVKQAMCDLVSFVTSFESGVWTPWRVADVSVWRDGEVVAEKVEVRA
ncbi:MAG: hypothetical protein HDQ98_05840 [Lachnospiraceae bacterium]|nr:hypothetical protein [Lachnospiraceae bacterium]